MGSRGPAPARDEERRRVNAPEHPVVKMGPDEMAKLPFAIDLAPTPPNPRDFMPEQEDDDESLSVVLTRDENGWHPYATYLWEQLQVDPSRAWNGPAAMALDLAMCENLSRLLMPRIAATIPASEHGPGEVVRDRLPLNGSEMAAVLKWASSRGLYENDRLRIGKEVTFYAGTAETKMPGDRPATVVSIKRNRREALTDSNEPDPLEMA